jgi:hypothetical protein
MLRAEIPDAWRAGLTQDLTALAARLTGAAAGDTNLQVLQADLPFSPSDEAYELTVAAEGIALRASSAAGARYGLRTLQRLLPAASLPCCRITDWPVLRYRGVQIDLGRVIERPDTVKRFLEMYASLNYNLLQLYLEDAFVFPSHPSLARPCAWTMQQALDVVEEAERFGLGVIPAIQSLGHCAWIGKHPDYADLDENHFEGSLCGVLCPSQPRALEMLEGMIHDVVPLATSGIIHLGMDESFSIGRCPRCAPRKLEIGEGGIFVEHANRVAAFTKAAGKRPAIWGDMFYYYGENLPNLDKDVLIFDWYYYIFERYPRVELYNFSELDSRALWAKYGLESWGCPMSVCPVSMPYNLPSEAIGNARSWARYLRETGGEGEMVTQWELSSTSLDLCPAIEGAVAGFLWGDTEAHAVDLLRASCAALYDRPNLAPLLEELGEYRLHGRHALAWLRAPSIAEMVPLDAAGGEEDLRASVRLMQIGSDLILQAHEARYGDTLRTFAVAARWLAYQYSKRYHLRWAPTAVAQGQSDRVAGVLTSLQEEAQSLAEAWQERWDTNRYPEDPAPLPAQLRKEADLFAEEIAALQSATAGEPYAGQFSRTLLAVHLVNTHPACPVMAVSTSADGQEFTERGKVCIIEFASHAAQPTSHDELTYTFPVDSPGEARFVRVEAVGDGRFSLRGVSVHRGDQRWGIRAVQSEGLVQGADRLLSGGLAVLGHPDPQALFRELLAQGDSSRIFSLPHGAVIAEMAVE